MVTSGDLTVEDAVFFHLGDAWCVEEFEDGVVYTYAFCEAGGRRKPRSGARKKASPNAYGRVGPGPGFSGTREAEVADGD